ncbi:hypothetical protein CHS0354_028454 [Potamilus streckersoni]|uniref:Uncharacterized protein n=1 Tax=Potamilus streckersoni TaxID=2493646 RepID=A0AAE0VSS6_9BIVA|nr:hypothetical protein CHS0354_028454 [Potamilus streckersoni]
MKIFGNLLVLFLTTNLFLMLIFTTKSLSMECPLFSSLIWEISNVMANCSYGMAYHCRVHNGQPIPFCHVIIDCPPGTFADLVKLSPSPKLQCVSCPDDRFDASGSRSNEISECRYKKQKCLPEDHKILWRPGSATSDNICYCDYKAGFDMDADIYGVIPKTNIKICDGFTRCECRPMLQCAASPDMCILPDKTCSEQCPPGYTRRYLDYNCVPKYVAGVPKAATTSMPGTTPTSPFTVSPGSMQNTPKPTEETPQSTNANEDKNWNRLVIVTAFLAFIVVLVLITLVIIFIWHRYQQGTGQHQRVAQTDT